MQHCSRGSCSLKKPSLPIPSLLLQNEAAFFFIQWPSHRQWRSPLCSFVCDVAPIQCCIIEDLKISEATCDLMLQAVFFLRLCPNCTNEKKKKKRLKMFTQASQPTREDDEPSVRPLPRRRRTVPPALSVVFLRQYCRV